MMDKKKLSESVKRLLAPRDLKTAFVLTRACLIELLKARGVRRLTKEEQLETWLDGLTLR